MAIKSMDIDEMFERLDDDTCRYCDDGDLTRGTYKDSQAVLCEDCGTPVLRSW